MKLKIEIPDASHDIRIGKESFEDTNTFIDASDLHKKYERWENLSSRLRWSVPRVICITSLNVRLMMEKLRRLRTPRVI